MPDQEIPTLDVQGAEQDLARISVFGLGKLGSPMAAVFAAAGYSVCGYDLLKEHVENLANGVAPVEETGLQELVDKARGKLTATSCAKTAIIESDVTFVIVPTPCDETGEFSNDYVLSAMEVIGQAIKSKSSRHLVVLTSTVMPGATGSVIKDKLEEASGLSVGGDRIGLCYSPEFIALGSVINDMRNPDFILIGESDKRSGNLLQLIYETSCAYVPVCYRMNFVNAELSKIAVNTFVTTKISYANMLADLCSKLEGADVDVVTDAVGADTRIGKKYLKGAVSYGGPCFPRDNRAFSALGKRVGADCGLAVATDALNSRQVDRLVAAVELVDPDAKTVGVLGLSYKPDTHVIEQSAGVDLVRELRQRGYDVAAYDPMAGSEAKKLTDVSDSVVATSAEALRQCDVAIVTTPWNEFKALDTRSLEGVKSIIDPWRILDADCIPAGTNLLSLGRSDQR